jgi:ribonuclease T2
MRIVKLTVLLLAALLATDGALAQRQTDRDKAGVFAYYVLALSWSPTYCASLRDARNDQQCGRTARPYAFVLHGLWPQHERGWPEFCESPDRGYVPRPVARRMRDIMPSDRLIFQQYRKHGTCSGLGVDGYFDLSRRLFEKVRIPSRFVQPTEERLFVSPSELMRDFIDANPKLAPDMISVTCGGPGNRLREVRICFDKAGEFRACGRNEDQRELCSADRMYVPPVRVGAGSRSRAPQREIVPGPRNEQRL